MAKKEFHISSNEPIIYFMQALIVVTVVLILSFGVFLMLFGNRYSKPAEVVSEDANSGVIQLTPEATAAGVSETDFVESVPSEIDTEKINTLFPEVKN